MISPVVFAFAASPLGGRRVDDAFAETATALAGRGVRIETYDAARGRITTRSGTLDGQTIVYRGWMMDAPAYSDFVRVVRGAGATPLHDLDAYLATHHAPRWLEPIADLGPDYRLFDATADLAHELANLAWPGYGIKDWVKSLKTSRGSIVQDPRDAPAVVDEMRKFRGTIEGGLVVRRREPLRVETERRYFVRDGDAHAATDAAIPPIVLEVARRITASRFFSVDVAERDDGVLRVVEIGDGQVSDTVGWTDARFASLWG